MVDISSLIDQLIKILVLIVVGFVCRKTGIIDKEADSRLSKIIVNVGCPCLLLSFAMGQGVALSSSELLWGLLYTAGWNILVFLVGLLFSRLFFRRTPARYTLSFLMSFGNIGIFGFSVILPLFGARGVEYTVLANVMFNTIAFTVGVEMIADGKVKGRELLKNMVNPPSIAAVLVVILFFLKLSFPVVVADSVNAMGSLTLPLTMFVIGSTLADQRFSRIVGDWSVNLTVFVKLVALPLIMMPITKLLVADATLRGVLIMLACMPTASLATSLCILYGSHAEKTSNATFLSTLLALLTIPAGALLLL